MGVAPGISNNFGAHDSGVPLFAVPPSATGGSRLLYDKKVHLCPIDKGSARRAGREHHGRLRPFAGLHMERRLEGYGQGRASSSTVAVLRT